MDFEKLSKYQMIFWYAMAGITLILLLIALPTKMFPPSYFFVPVICVVMAFLRTWQLKKIQKSSAVKRERDSKNKKKG